MDLKGLIPFLTVGYYINSSGMVFRGNPQADCKIFNRSFTECYIGWHSIFLNISILWSVLGDGLSGLPDTYIRMIPEGAQSPRASAIITRMIKH